MMLCGRLGKRIAGAIICLTVLLMISPPVFAAKPHEDPETAEQVFSGISLFKYYSDALEFVLQKSPAEFEALLEKIPFANIPPGLKATTYELASSGITLSRSVVAIDEGLDKLRALLKQFRLDEATEQAGQISDNLSQANSELERIERAIKAVGLELKLPSAPAGSTLRYYYEEALDRTSRVREMLALYKDLLKDLQGTQETEEVLQSTDITLAIQPKTSFVGENISFDGVLISEENPLAERKVDILVDGSRYATVETDDYGRYQGTLPVPYWYIPELDLRALYYPQDKDTGVYLASLSPVIKLKVLFYKGRLGITTADKAYPGLETTVSGGFDYGQSPPPNERKVEIYVDNVLATDFMAEEAFAQEIKIDPETGVGEHIITVSSGAVGRYAPLDTSAILNVTRVIPVLDITIPGVAMIPGSVGLQGKLYSEVGPVSEALIKMGLGKAQVEVVSSEDGSFDSKIRAGLGLGMIGSQDLVIQVLPQEPWYAPLKTTSSILMVNVVNCGVFVALILFLGIYLPRRLRRRLGAYPRTITRPAIATVQPEPIPTYSERATVLTSIDESDEASAEPRNRIFHWYRLVVRFLQGMTKTLPGPQQTLREFANESSRILGPATKYFIELTKTVERLLYSQYRPTERDVRDSRQLSNKIEEATKLRAATEPLLGLQFPGEGISEARAFELGGGAATTNPWRQPSVWLWIVMILALVYYACILFFVLPVLVT